MNYFTIKEIYEHEIINKKSRFICKLIPVSNKEMVDSYLKSFKKEYADARHICYGYIIGIEQQTSGSSDDKEPKGTAGVQILSVLTKKKITNCLCVIIRYFGGVKLGASLLARTYARCAKETIEKASILELTKGYEYKLIFSYEKQNLIDILTKNINIIDKTFTDNITYIVESTEILSDSILKNCIKAELIKESYITKKRS